MIGQRLIENGIGPALAPALLIFAACMERTGILYSDAALHRPLAHSGSRAV